MKEKIILIGGGGHCKSCIDVIEQEGRFEIAGIVERAELSGLPSVLGFPIVGEDDDLPDLRKRYDYALVTVGQIKTSRSRVRIYKMIKKLEFSLPKIVSPTAYVSPHASVGEGTIVMHHALVNAGAEIGANCIINTKALVEHDAIVEDHCHISTGAVINGGVRVGSGTFFGSNSVTKEYISIGTNSVIGCGAKVMKNIPKTP